MINANTSVVTDLILVDPPVTFASRLGKLEKTGSFLPSLGLCYLAAVAKELGFSSKIIDANLINLSLSNLARKILQEKPRWVGLSATTLTIDIVGKIAAMLKKRAPRTIIIVGGSHLTALPEETLKRYLGIDIGVIGEGEETLKELLLSLDSGKPLQAVKGLVFRKGKRLILTESRPPIQNLDGLPRPDWSFLPGFPQRYRPAVNTYLQLPAAHLVTSRGCTGVCLFCDRSVFGRLPRLYSAQEVLDLIEHLIKNYGVREIQFFDDNFALSRRRIKEICQGLIKKGRPVTWSCQARADMLDLTTLQLMRKAGCWQIGLGIESGSEKILKILKKKETTQRLRETVEAAVQAGIEVKGFFILGSPGETRESLNETMKFILSLPLSYIQLNYFTPFPGSGAYGVAQDYGLFKFKDYWSKLGRGTVDPIFIPRSLTKEILEKKAAEIFKRFYFQPRIIYHNLEKIILRPHLWLPYLKAASSVISFSNFTKK